MPRSGWQRQMRRLHEWAGVVTLAGLVVVGATGAAGVFLGELFRLQYGAMLAVPAGQHGLPEASMDRLVTSAAEGYGAGFLPQGVLMPHSRIPLDVALVYGAPEGADPGEPLMLAVNPYTGAYQGSFWLDDALGHELVHLHADLLAGEGGRLVVVGLGVAMVLFTASGLYLWWPRAGAPGHKLKTSLRRRPLSVFALHGLAGITLGPVLVFYAVTGIATAKPSWLEPLVVSPFSNTPTLVDPGEEASHERWITLAEAVAIGQAEHPGRRLASLQLRGDARLVGMTFEAPGDLDHYYGDGHAWVDRRDGRLLETFVAGQHSPAIAAGAAMHSLHSGLFFGIPGMVASVLSGAALVGISGLGVVLWWRRWRQRRSPLPVSVRG